MKGLGTRLHTGGFLAGASDRLGHAYVDFAEESQAEVHCLALSSWVAPRFQVQCEAQESVCRGASLTVRVCRGRIPHESCLQLYLYQGLSVVAHVSWQD